MKNEVKNPLIFSSFIFHFAFSLICSAIHLS